MDIVAVDRIKRVVERWNSRFLDRVFTSAEQEYCMGKRKKYVHLAGRFAAKEAVMKALGDRTPWRAVEICSSRRGKPIVTINWDRVPEQKNTLPNGVIHLSISHDGNYAVSTAVLEVE